MSTPELFTYWQGDIPEHVEKCLDVSRKYGMQVYDETAMTFPDHIVEPHHRSDYFRAHKLASDGGAYIDADAILYRAPDEWFSVSDEFNLYGCGWHAGEPSIGLLMATGNNWLATEWSVAQEIEEGAGWTSYGASLLWPLVKSQPDCFVGQPSCAFCAPFRNAGVLMEHKRAQSAWNRNAICTHLNNKTTGSAMTDAMRDPQTLVSQLLCIARHRAGLS